MQNILVVPGNTIHANAVRKALVDSSDGAFRVIWVKKCCDALGHLAGNATYLNMVRIVDGATREVARDPVMFAIRENKVVALTPNCVLIRRDGFDCPIEDSAAMSLARRRHRQLAIKRAAGSRLSHSQRCFGD